MFQVLVTFWESMSLQKSVNLFSEQSMSYGVHCAADFRLKLTNIEDDNKTEILLSHGQRLQ